MLLPRLGRARGRGRLRVRARGRLRVRVRVRVGVRVGVRVRVGVGVRVRVRPNLRLGVCSVRGSGFLVRSVELEHARLHHLARGRGRVRARDSIQLEDA